MAPRKRFNPQTGRWQDVQTTTESQSTTTTTEPKQFVYPHWRNTGDAKDRRGYEPPTAMSRNAPSITPQDSPPPTGDPLAGAFEEYGDDPAFAELLRTLFDAGGSGSGGPSRADRQRAARTVKQAGRQAKKDYTRLGEEGFARTMDEANKYYGGRETTARGQIDDATKAFLESLIAPTAYTNTPLPNMQVQQQGLGESLGAYGATGDLARQQQMADQGELDFASQLSKNTMGQLNTAQTNYLDAIRNAGLGAQAAARTGLTQNLESMRGMTRAQADAVRQQLLQQGIEALISGNQNAANAYL